MIKEGSFLSRFNEKYNWKFVAIYLVLSFLFFGAIMDLGPLNMHVWRQGDSLSMTMKFYNGASFWEPQMHGLWGNDYTTGRSAGEFPILYYIVAQLWKIFGVSYFIYRLFFFVILTVGIFSFYRSLKLVLKNEFWATCISILLFSSPVYAVYSVSFITDGPAFSFNLIALYFLTRFALDNRRKFFYWSMCFFALAGLVKVSALIIFVFIGFIFLLERLPIKTLGSKKLFEDWKLGIGFVCAIGAIVSWYTYAHFYNTHSGYMYTFNNIYPIWKLDAASSMDLLNDIKNHTSRVFFSRPMIMVIFFLFFFNLTLYKKISLLPYLANIIVFLGAIIYFMLWAPLMGVHDYYFVALVSVFIGVVVPFIFYLQINLPTIYSGKITKNAVYVFMSFNLLIALSTIKLKTTAKKGDYVIMDGPFVRKMKWFNNDNVKWQNMAMLKDKFNAMGVKNSEKILCLSDDSFNASLFLMDHDGWTNFQHFDSDAEIKMLISKGAKFLVIQQRDLEGKSYLAPFTKNLIGSEGDILVFRL